jgi:hypothetical protein
MTLAFSHRPEQPYQFFVLPAVPAFGRIDDTLLDPVHPVLPSLPASRLGIRRRRFDAPHAQSTPSCFLELVVDIRRKQVTQES